MAACCRTAESATLDHRWVRRFHSWLFANEARILKSGRPMMTIWTRCALLGAFLAMMVAAPARAEGFEDNMLALIRKVGVHGNLSVRHPTDNDVTRGVTFGPSIGLSPGRTNGWKYPVALSMFSQDLHSPSGAQFGSVRTWALVGGIGYGWHFRELSVGPQVEVGYTFNHSSLDGNAAQAFASPGSVSLDVSNAWMVRPEFKAEYMLTTKFSIRSSIDYVRLRPDVTVMTPTGTVPNTWDLSNVHANVGVAFYPFRKEAAPEPPRTATTNH
jgi:hypothetical protein